MRNLISKRHFFTSVVSITLSVFMVAVVAFASSTMDTASVGAGTSTPGAALGVKGAGLVEGNIWTSSVLATSTSFASGFGTTAPGAEFAVAGGGLFSGGVIADSYTATSTVATSTIKYNFDVATSSLIVSGNTGQVLIGTSTLPKAGSTANTMAVDPALTVTGVGSTANATGTLYVGGPLGGQIILKSSDGNNCVSLIATTGALDPNTDTAGTQTVPLLVSARVVACPR